MHPIKHLTEFYRVVANLYLTEQGLYRQMPLDYKSLLVVEVVYRICHADKDGRIVVMDFNNPVSATQSRNTETKQYFNIYGGPVKLDQCMDQAGRTNVLWFEEPVSVDVGGTAGAQATLNLITKINPRISTQFNQTCTAMHKIAKAEEGFAP